MSTSPNLSNVVFVKPAPPLAKPTKKTTLGIHQGGPFSAPSVALSKPMDKPNPKKTSEIPPEVLERFEKRFVNQSAVLESTPDTIPSFEENGSAEGGHLDQTSIPDSTIANDVNLNQTVIPPSEVDIVSYLTVLKVC